MEDEINYGTKHKHVLHYYANGKESEYKQLLHWKFPKLSRNNTSSLGLSVIGTVLYFPILRIGSLILNRSRGMSTLGKSAALSNSL